METLTHEFISKAKSFINDAHHIAIVTHKNPDGDAIGSAMALFHYFINIQKKVTFFTPNKLPANVNWMPLIDEVIVYENNKDKGAELLQQADLILMVDFNHRSRLSEMGDKIIPMTVPKIMIDHHPEPEDICDIIYSRVSSSSTAELIYEFIDALSGEESVTRDMAESLFMGIMTDTGSFSYNSSSPRTFEVVAKLLTLGVDKDKITDRVYNNFSEGRLRLLGKAVSTNLTVVNEYKSAYIVLTKDDLNSYNFEYGDTENVVNYPLSIRDVVFSAIFIEKDNYTKCSFRSKGNFPANKVAKEHFSGGGHMNAAGGEFKGSLQQAVQKFESILSFYKEYID